MPMITRMKQRDHGPRDLERRIAVHVLGLGLAGTLAILDQRLDENRFDEDEDGASRPKSEF